MPWLWSPAAARPRRWSVWACRTARATGPTAQRPAGDGPAHELHDAGATPCAWLVTHDSRYAERAERTVRLFDGKLQESAPTAGTGADA